MYPVSTPLQIAPKFWNNLVNEINEHDLFQVIFSLPHCQMISPFAGPESICFWSWARLAYTPDVQHANIQVNSTWARIWHV